MKKKPFTKKEMASIKRGLADIKAGRVHTIEEVAKYFNIELK